MSQRHLSFIECGKTAPSRQAVLCLAAALDMPLRSRNELLHAAGFAPVYPERPLDAPTLEQTRKMLVRVLKHHEPYPSMVLDRYWNIVMRNVASKRIVGMCLEEAAQLRLSTGGKLNFMRMMFHPKGLRPYIRNWEDTAQALLSRLRREAASNPGSPSESLLHELLSQEAHTGVTIAGEALLQPVAALELEIGGKILRLFNTLTTFGTPQDVTLQELRIEMSFPMDDATARLLRSFAGHS